MRYRQHASVLFLAQIGFCVGLLSNSIAQEGPEIRAARACAGLTELQGNFSGKLDVGDLTIVGDGSGTIKLEQKGAAIGNFTKGSYSDYNKCLIDVIKLLLPNKPITYKLCALPEFGLSGWAKEETLNGTSGWKGGGYNQNAFCNDFINATLTARALPGSGYKVETVTSSEEGRWTGTFGRDRQYNYHCTIRLYVGPIYNSKQDPRCGVE